ncbi:MAG TPA: type II secretion system F family protein [Terriglobia bacterium]|nr:type II secretion system F family protein [Terriglobia bacterium]
MASVLLATFLGSSVVALALYYAFTARTAPTADRLSNLWTVSSGSSKWGVRLPFAKQLRGVLNRIGELIPASPQEARRTEKVLVRAGFRRPEALKALRGLKLIFPIVLLAIALASGIYRINPIFMVGGSLMAGFVLPELWLTRRVRVRQQRIQRGLPDVLDLLVICVEGGLGLDQAVLRVSRELARVHRDLSEELQLVNFEVRVGKTRAEALRSFANRTGVDDVQALASILVQADRFGTSVAQSLRIYSDTLRTKRRQRAEELAAKTSVKMIPVLVLFIFPSLFVVVLGPAVITLMHQLARMR